MPTAKAQLTALSHLGFAVETTLGTPVAATGWVPVTRLRPQDVPQYVPDTGYRGRPFQTYGQYLAVKSSTYDVDGFLYPQSGGNLLCAVTGTDTVSGTASPYTHTFSFAQVPPSYTVSDTYLGEAGVGRQWPGSRCHRLQLKFTPEAGLSYTASFIGFPSVSYTPETTTFGVDPFFLGWEAALSFGGVQDANLSSFSLDIQRVGSKPLWSAANTQSPYDIFIGEAKALWDLEFYMLSDSEYAYALSQGVVATSVTLTQPGTGYSLELISSALQFTKPTINRSGKWVLVQITGEAVYNATDAGILQVILKNGVSTSYSTQAAS
jgi:hypothetical protein